MKLFIFSILLIVGVTGIKTGQLDDGPQTFTNSDLNSPSPTTETPKTPKRYATKEVMMYLTPTQIKALNSGQAYLTTQLAAQLGAGSLPQQEFFFNMRNQDEDIKRENELLQTTKPIEEVPKEYPSIPLPQKAYNFVASNYFATKPTQKLLFNPDLERDKLFGRLLSEQEKNIPLQEGGQTGWIPINPIPYPKPENLLFKQSPFQMKPILQDSNIDFKSLQILPFNLDELVESKQIPPLKYPSNYEIIKNIQGSDTALGLNSQELEKQKSLAEIVAIANSLPVIAHSKAVSKKRLQESTPVYKHVLVPLPLFLKKHKMLPQAPFFYSSLDLDKLN